MKNTPKNTSANQSKTSSPSATTKREKSEGNKSFFGFIDGLLQLDEIFANGIPPKYLPRILFMAMLGIVYIGNSHFANKTIVQLTKVKAETEDLRVDYTSLKADYMLRSKQSEVAKRVAPMGLEESSVPPQKIELEEQ